MKNSSLYITPYGKQKEQKPNQFVCFMLSFFFALAIATEIMCILILIV